jgi:HEAT repeat protein
MAHHDSAQIRASAAVIYGHSAGGTERRRDVLDSLRLLEDRDPLVRGAAASTLGTIYSTAASERYLEGWADVRGALQRQLKEELDPAARRAIGDALKEGGP